MKNVLMLAVAICLSLNLLAQENAINQYFSAYQQDKSFTKVMVTSEMFDLFNELDPDDPEEQEILEAMSQLEGIKGLFNDEVSNGISMYKDALNKIGTGNYKELMVVEDKDENVTFLIKKESGTIKELLMLNGAPKRFIAMSLYGVIDLKSIAKIAKVMNVRGMEQLKAFSPDQKQ